ncbi:hypothetical protein FV219_01545 [Methylobacterium sp. WL122]|nr:hypothetical protein FV219_01545 [Methylobacterium sp. WL122]
MGQQYIRKVVATINDVEISSDGDNGLRIVFGTRQGLSSTPHHANIIITNPAPSTIVAMRKEKAKVTLRAGYRDGGAGLIFEGELLQLRNGRENVSDTYAHAIATSGENGRNYATVNKALAAGHTYKDRIDTGMAAFGKLGLKPGFIDNLPTRKFPRNYVAHSMAHDLFRETCQAVGASWWIQGDRVNVLRAQNTIPGNTHVINADTGMVGLPEQTIEGIIVRTLLNYDIYPGSAIKLNNASIQQAALSPSTGAGANNEDYIGSGRLAIGGDGTYKVWRVEHEGDTRGQQYFTTLTCTLKERPQALGDLMLPSDVDQAGVQ